MNRSGTEVAKLLKLIHKSMNESIRDKFQYYGFTVPQLIVMGALYENERMKVSQISAELNLSNSTISAMISNLEKKHIIKRIKCTIDRRVTYIELEDQYKKIAKELHGEIEKYLDNILGKATDEEVQSIIIGLENLQKLIEK